MSYLRVRNWDKFQHYKNKEGAPSWIKVYTKLVLPRSDYLKLSLEARGLLTGLWLLAANYANAIPNDPEHIAKLLGSSPEACREALLELRKTRWILVTQTARRSIKKSEAEKRREEKNPPTPLRGSSEQTAPTYIAEPCADCGKSDLVSDADGRVLCDGCRFPNVTAIRTQP